MTGLPTVYPKKYTHGFCFAVLCCGYTLTDFPISIRLTSLAMWQSNDCPNGGNLTIAPMPAKQPWWIWINTSCEFIMNDCITTTKQSTTKPCAYFLGYTVASGLCLNSLFFSGFSGGADFLHIFVYISNTIPHINLNWMQITRRQMSKSQ